MKHTKNLYARVNAILDSCAKINILVRPLKLQKLIYLNYLIYLQQGGDKLDYMNFEAWNYGPVIKKVYDYYKEYKANYIRKKMAYVNKFPILVGDTSIDTTTAIYGKLSDSRLVNLTHKKDGAWEKAFKSENDDIDFEYIKKESIYLL